MGKSSNAPPPVDPYQSAAAQYQYGTAAADYNAALNRTGNTNAAGSSGWNVTGTDPRTGAPLYGFSTQLAPSFEQSMQPLNTSDIYGTNNGPEAGIGGLPQIQNALYQQQEQYLQPQQALQTEGEQSLLANSGATIGSPAYNNAMSELNREQTFSNNAAANSAISGATGQEAQLQSIGIGGLGAQEQAGLYGPQLFSALSGNPAAASTAAPDIQSAFNARYQGQLNAANAQNAANNQTTGDLSSLAALYALYAFE